MKADDAPRWQRELMPLKHLQNQHRNLAIFAQTVPSVVRRQGLVNTAGNATHNHLRSLLAAI